AVKTVGVDLMTGSIMRTRRNHPAGFVWFAQPPDLPHSDAIVSAIRSGDCDSILTSWTGQYGTPILAKSRRR
ncbi:MAG: hypothetical protein U9Q37_04140, partial [Euryarchaeota archaeon]|nr:hypothetical protein [Euryarchaeota archaeon]